jgi:hypothetical protein
MGCTISMCTVPDCNVDTCRVSRQKYAYLLCIASIQKILATYRLK